MSTDLAILHNEGNIAMQETITQTRNYIENAKSAATRRAYQTDWKDFTGWCLLSGVEMLPASPETVCLYVSRLAQSCKVATITRRLAAISQAHQAAGHETPTHSALVRATMQGIKRVKGTAPNMKAPVTTEDLRKMLANLPETLAAKRDRALLLLGFAGAFRRAELVALDREDLHFTERGIEVTIRRSKTDQEGQGRKIAIPYGSRLETCPVRSLRAWLDAAGITQGALFLSISRHGAAGARLTSQSVALVVKKYVETVGLDPDVFGGHSLRAGFATSAAAAGVEERVIQKQTGHKGVTMLRRYIREGDLWRDCAAADVGL